jgi:predicted nucleotidyltransferase component of viral defense system
MSLALARERAATEGLPLAIVAAESLHVILLDALFAHPGGPAMAFQGGTCLHLVHGGYRYSEDIDLAGADLDGDAAARIIERARPDIERLAVQVLGQGEPAWKAPRTRGRVTTCWFHFTPRETSQRIRVKIELARFPTYHAVVLPVRSSLDLLERRPLVTALPPGELLAQKVTAALGRRYLKGRDLFDLWFLDAVLGTASDLEPDPDLLRRKLEDYDVAPSRHEVRERLDAVAAADLEPEMSRFLPRRQRDQLGRESYRGIRERARDVLERAARAVGLA